MEAIRQIYEKMPSFITIPAELRDRHVEVIIRPLDQADSDEAITEEPESEWIIADPEALRFAGSMPDFPPRDPQGSEQIREGFR